MVDLDDTLDFRVSMKSVVEVYGYWAPLKMQPR